MKYIKKFENNEYESDDYVMIINPNEPIIEHSKIVKLLKTQTQIKGKRGDKVNLYIAIHSNGERHFIEEYYIIRKATLDEIEQYEFDQDTKNFNL